MTDDTEAREALIRRMEEVAENAEDPTCSIFYAVELIRDGVAMLRSLPAAAALLRANDWLVCPPDHIPLPRSQEEAAKTLLLCEHYLRANGYVVEEPRNEFVDRNDVSL